MHACTGQALGYQSARALSDYEGLVDLARQLYISLPGDAEREKCVGDLFRAFPSHPQLLQVGRRRVYPCKSAWKLV